MINVLIAILVVFVTGMVAAVILALASYYMAVPENAKVSEVRECLPGANCGACGYTGCDGYAEAVASGKAASNLCIPGGASVAKAISEITGASAEEFTPPVAFVHCNGTSDAAVKTAEYEGLKTCAAMCLSCSGDSACKYGCLGCGDCADSCPVDAICLEDGIARINREICIGCGACVKTCPKHIISLIPRTGMIAVACSSCDAGAQTRKNCKNGCIACKKCEKTCPNGAITVINNCARIDYDKCTSCGLCRDVCPTGCIISVG